jgi:hypothetical protein
MPGAPSSAWTDEPGIVGQCRQVRRRSGGARFEFRIADECRLGLLRLWQLERCRRDHLDAKGRQQLGDLARLAGIVTGDDQAAIAEQPMRTWQGKRLDQD